MDHDLPELHPAVDPAERDSDRDLINTISQDDDLDPAERHIIRGID
jgi:hypothetical protein